MGQKHISKTKPVHEQGIHRLIMPLLHVLTIVRDIIDRGQPEPRQSAGKAKSVEVQAGQADPPRQGEFTGGTAADTHQETEPVEVQAGQADPPRQGEPIGGTAADTHQETEPVEVQAGQADPPHQGEPIGGTAADTHQETEPVEVQAGQADPPRQEGKGRTKQKAPRKGRSKGKGKRTSGANMTEYMQDMTGGLCTKLAIMLLGGLGMKFSTKHNAKYDMITCSCPHV